MAPSPATARRSAGVSGPTKIPPTPLCESGASDPSFTGPSSNGTACPPTREATSSFRRRPESRKCSALVQLLGRWTPVSLPNCEWHAQYRSGFPFLGRAGMTGRGIGMTGGSERRRGRNDEGMEPFAPGAAQRYPSEGCIGPAPNSTIAWRA